MSVLHHFKRTELPTTYLIIIMYLSLSSEIQNVIVTWQVFDEKHNKNYITFNNGKCYVS